METRRPPKPGELEGIGEGNKEISLPFGNPLRGLEGVDWR